MSEDELYDEYDDEDDSIFEDEAEGEDFEDDILDEEYEDYEEDDDEDEDEDYYDEEGLSSEGSCFICSEDGEDVPEDERWKFAVADEEGRLELWTCKSCRDKFKTLEDFDHFRTEWTRSQLYRCAARLQKLILLKAPDCLIANTVFVMAGCLFTEDAVGLKPHAVDELKKLKGRAGGQG